MNTSIVAAMKEKAAKNLKFKDVCFVDFEAIDIEEMGATITGSDLEEFSSTVEVSANLKIGYEGVLPESYRVINGMVQDWVDAHDEDLKKIINPKLIPFLKEHYKNVDVSDLQQDFDDYIWEDQVDYTPEIDEDKKEIKFSVDLVLEVEEVEADED